VLDLGCGFGDFARKARQRGARHVLGIDISARMLEEAARRTEGPGIDFQQGSLEDLEPEPLPFDLAVSSLTLHYVRDYADALARVAHNLRPGGKLVISVEHPMCTARAEQTWVRDAEGKALFWPVDGYRQEGERSTHWFVDHVVKYHRTVETHVNGLLDAGFRLTRLLEPAPVPEMDHGQVPNLDLQERRPPFLVLAGERL
jgi:ubiquinone/menaquinone biosynthesis C-methylase UbiE